jgi:hypothetical protein
MIFDNSSLVQVEIGRYNNRKEYRIIFSGKNLNYARAGCPDTGKLVGRVDKNITFNIYLSPEGIISKELELVSVHGERKILIGNADSLDKTINEFKQVPIFIPKNSKEKLLVGYVTMALEK